MAELPFGSTEAMTAFVLVFARITGVTLSAPLFSSRGFPIPLRMWIALLLSLMMAPVVGTRLAEGIYAPLLTSELGAALAIISELAIGWTIGWVASVMVFAAQLAGHILGQEIGFSIGEVFDPMSGNQSGITAQLFFTFGLVAFVILGGPHLVVHALNDSFTVLPPGGLMTAAGAAPGLALLDPQILVVEAGGSLWSAGVTMALPGMVGLMLASAAMAILARSVPEMNVFVLGFTIRIVLGLLTTWLVLPFIGEIFAAYVAVTHEMLADFLSVGGR